MKSRSTVLLCSLIFAWYKLLTTKKPVLTISDDEKDDDVLILDKPSKETKAKKTAKPKIIFL